MAAEQPAGTRRRRRPSEEGEQPGSAKQLLPTLGYVLGGVVLVGYFVWMCGEMASHASNGIVVPICIFGGVLLGVVAGAASLITTKRR